MTKSQLQLIATMRNLKPGDKVVLKDFWIEKKGIVIETFVGTSKRGLRLKAEDGTIKLVNFYLYEVYKITDNRKCTCGLFSVPCGRKFPGRAHFRDCELFEMD